MRIQIAFVLTLAFVAVGAAYSQQRDYDAIPRALSSHPAISLDCHGTGRALDGPKTEIDATVTVYPTTGRLTYVGAMFENTYEIYSQEYSDFLFNNLSQQQKGFVTGMLSRDTGHLLISEGFKRNASLTCKLTKPLAESKNVSSTLFALLVGILIAIPAGLIPAFIARSKGRSFLTWWIYGAALFIAALPHSLLLRRPIPQQITGSGSTGPKEAKLMQPTGGMEEREYRPPGPVRQTPRSNMQVMAIVLMCIAFLVGVYAFELDTTVKAGSDRVYNIGLMENRRNLLLIAGLLIIVGVILFVTDKVTSQQKGQNQLPTAYPADRSLESDEYQLYLVKTYAIEKNNTLEKYVVNGKLFASVEDALRHAHALDVAEEERQAAENRERQVRLERGGTALVGAKVEKPSTTPTAQVAVAVERPSATRASPIVEPTINHPTMQLTADLEIWIARRKSGEPLAPVLRDLQHALDRGEVTTAQFAEVRRQLLLL